jgi:hypothetical protein
MRRHAANPLGYSELLALLPLLGNRLLIEGAAGSGKTTVLQWTALEALLVRAGGEAGAAGLARRRRTPSAMWMGAIGDPQRGLLDEVLRSIPRLARGPVGSDARLEEAAADWLGEGGPPAGKPRLDAEPWHARTPFFVRLASLPEGRLLEPDGLPALIAHGAG